MYKDFAVMPRSLKESLLRTNDYELPMDHIIPYDILYDVHKTITQIVNALTNTDLPDFWIVTLLNDSKFYVVFETTLTVQQEDTFFKAISNNSRLWDFLFTKEGSYSKEAGIYAFIG